jgi:hypothetical protein
LKVAEEQAWADHWQQTAEEIEKVIQAAINEAAIIYGKTMTPSFLLDELFKGQCKNIDDLPANHPLLKSGKLAGDTFTLLVDFLRSPTNKNKSVRSLMALFWDLVGNRITPTAITNGVPTLSFYAERMNGRFNGFVLCPEDWCQMIKEEFPMQLGSSRFQRQQSTGLLELKTARNVGDQRKRQQSHFRSGILLRGRTAFGSAGLEAQQVPRKSSEGLPFWAGHAGRKRVSLRESSLSGGRTALPV